MVNSMVFETSLGVQPIIGRGRRSSLRDASDGMGGQKKGKKNFKQFKGVASRGAKAASTATVAKKEDDDDLKCDGAGGVLGRGVATCCATWSEALTKMCVPCYVKYVKPLAGTFSDECCPECERNLTELLRPMVTESRGTFALDATRELVRAFRSQCCEFEGIVRGVIRTALTFASMDVMQWITGDGPVTEFGDKFPSRAAIMREACKVANVPATPPPRTRPQPRREVHNRKAYTCSHSRLRREIQIQWCFHFVPQNLWAGDDRDVEDEDEGEGVESESLDSFFQHRAY